MRRHPRTMLLLAAAALACESGAPADHPASSAEPAVHEGFLDTADGVQLFYRTVGAGPDTLVVVHGGPGFTMDYFAEDLEPLAARHTLVFYDQRGTGRSTLVSDSAALDAQRFAEDVEALRGHLGLERVTLLGHSWGAGVVALYAARFPQRVERLLIVGGIPLHRGPLLQAFDEMQAGRDSATLRRMGEWREARLADPGDAEACRAYYVLWFQPFFGDSTAAARSRGDFCAGTPEARANKIRSVDRYTMASLGDYDWRGSLRDLRAPTLVIHGTEDPLPLTGAREWAATLPDARLLVLQGVGHFPYVEAPDTFFSAVETFLRGDWPGAAAEPGT